MSTIEKHDMTQGKILLPLVSFTIPLVLGNLFQLTYNAADSVIVGKYVGEQALAAVGTSTPIMNIAILLISGMCMGASVLMSSQYGAKDYDTLSRQISTTMLAGCGFSDLCCCLFRLQIFFYMFICIQDHSCKHIDILCFICLQTCLIQVFFPLFHPFQHGIHGR